MNPYAQVGEALGDEGMAVWGEDPGEHGLSATDFAVTCIRVDGILYGGRLGGFTVDLALAAHLQVTRDLRSPRVQRQEVSQCIPGLPNLDWNPEQLTLTRARVYFTGQCSGPWLEFTRRPPGVDQIAMHGLECASLGQAERLLRALRALRQIVAGGRPSGPSEGWRAKVEEAERLKRRDPSRTWEQIAGRLLVPERTLRRWRRQA